MASQDSAQTSIEIVCQQCHSKLPVSLDRIGDVDYCPYCQQDYTYLPHSLAPTSTIGSLLPTRKAK